MLKNSALVRQQARNRPGMTECIACGGSGKSSKGGECRGCEGTGAKQELAQHSSETNEHYSPALIVEAARKLMGAIDLDPASCPMAQEVVKASEWYGPGSNLSEDGFAIEIGKDASRIFLNPPGGLVPDEHAEFAGTKSNAAFWWAVWSSMWQAGEIEQMVFVGFTLEILRSAQGLDVPQPLDFPMCVPSSRIRFDCVNAIRTKGKRKGELIDPSKPAGARVTGDSPTHANVIIYLPRSRDGMWGRGSPNVERFVEVFTPIGRCRI